MICYIKNTIHLPTKRMQLRLTERCEIDGCMKTAFYGLKILKGTLLCAARCKLHREGSQLVGVLYPQFIKKDEHKIISTLRADAPEWTPCSYTQ